MSKGVVVLFLVALFCHSSVQIGILYVNAIWGNFDTHKVLIEDVVIDDTTMIVDFINKLTPDGVFVEQVQFIDGNVNVPGFIHVHGNATLHGALHADGGIYADDGDPATDNVWSFIVVDNTGDTYVAGQLRPDGGINSDNCHFTVHNITGDTRLCCALLHPNGGIELGDSLFDVSSFDGSFRTKGDGIVALDFLLGGPGDENHLVTRIPAATPYGGNTFIKGQDGKSYGGNLVIVPGESSGFNANGNLYFGRAFNDQLYIGRSGLDAKGTTGGETTIGGQDAFDGIGGDLFLNAGAGQSTRPIDGIYNGGNILFDVGLSSENGKPGRILLGTDRAGESNFDLIFRRPFININSAAGATIFQGQSTDNSLFSTSGGDIYLQAGDVTDGPGSPGDLAIIPGLAVNGGTNVQGIIGLGNDNSDLSVTRLDVYGAAGDTYFIAQDCAQSGIPGDLYLHAGDAGASAFSLTGGDLWIMPGSSPFGQPGKIYWGNKARDLSVVRFNAGANAPQTTTLNAQSSVISSGGDYNIYGGDGNVQGGGLSLRGGQSANGNVAGTAGTISISAGNGNSNGGSVFINGGFGNSLIGGAISVLGGANTGGGTGGTITFNAGTAASGTAGNINIGPSASSFFVDGAQILVSPPFITLLSGPNTLIVDSTAPGSILRFNGNTLLQDTVQNIPAINTLLLDPNVQADTYTVVNSLSATLQAIVCALGPSGHGLVNVVSPNDDTVTCPLP